MKASHLLPTASILRRCIALLVVEIDHRAGKCLIFHATQIELLYVYKFSIGFQCLIYMGNAKRSVSGKFSETYNSQDVAYPFLPTVQ